MGGFKLLMLIVFALMFMPGCTSAPPPPTLVPVAVQADPPPELLEPILPPSAVFIAPGDPTAVACIGPAGRDAIVRYVDDLRTRVRAWSAWALTPATD
ncbi:MAG: hypothetical protein ACT6Q8_24180 [Niveispirillum sp.]|uniref:hypothetical protein n=1 Tax=Niveispirillum sp. TaxID=1917217 RepID=UPI004036E72F